MSIEATYTNKEVKSIREHVEGKPSRVPFLLLPVRIETRFMKVEKSVFSFDAENSLSNIIESLANLDLLITIPKTELKPPQQKEMVKNVQDLTKKTINEIEGLEAVNKSQKILLVEWKNTLEEKIEQIQSELNPPYLKRIKNTLSQLEKKVNAVNDTQAPLSENATAFLQEMVKLKDDLSLFAEQKTPFTSHEKKKKLYDFVDGKIEEVKRFYDHAQTKIGNIVYLENGQLDKLKRLHESIKNQTLKLADNISRVHSDKSWQTFVRSRKHYLQNDFPPLFKNFEQEVLTQLSKLHQVKPVDANLYLSKSLSLRNSIHQMNQTGQIQYGELKAFRKYVEKKSSLLNKMGTNILHGSENQKEKIKQSFLQLNNSFSSLEGNLTRVNVKNRSQKFGLETTKTKLAKLKPEIYLTGSLNHTNRTDLVDNLGLLHNLKSTTRKLQNKMSKNSRIGINQLTEVRDLLKTIKVAIRKKSQFYPEELNNFKTEVRSLAIKSRTGNFTSGIIKINFQAAVNNVQNEIRRLEENLLQTGKQQGIQFVNTTKIVNELWLRIYPDDIFVHTHEKQLSEVELNSGKRYWKTVWAVDEEHDLTVGAWRSLTAAYGSKRAAWITKVVGDAKKYKNNEVKTNNPSKKISESQGHLSGVAEILKTVSNKSRAAALGKLNFDEITKRLISASDIYKILEHKPQLVYFLQKSVTSQQRIYSKLQVIAEVFHRDNTFSNPEVIAKFNKIAKVFEELHTNFSKITPLRTDQFLEKIQEPYTYKDKLKTKDEHWSVAPHTKVLPKRFVAIARNNQKFEIIHAGKTIPDELQLGMDPAKFQFESENDNPFRLDKNGDLIVEEGMKWMVDFDESVKQGMGMRISLSAAQADKGFDELYVLGVSEDTVSNDTARLEELFENHHYATFGMEFLKVGTPTNNTQDSKAGFSSQDIDAEESYRIEMQGPLFGPTGSQPFKKPDGSRLAEALGIKEAHFHNINNSNLLQVSNAKAMHKALWNSTIGVYMEDMWDKLFTYDNIERTYKYFTDQVTARGVLPPIRVASQPYGILPVTSFSQLSFSNTWDEDNLPTLTAQELKNPVNASVQNKLQYRYDVRFKQLLKKGEFIWSLLQKSKVNHAGNIGKHENPQPAFVNMLGLTATSTEYYFRYGVNINDRSANELTIDTINFDDEVPYSPQKANFYFADLLKKGYFVPSFVWEDEISPVSDKEKQTAKMNSRIRDQFFASRIFTYRLLNRHSLLNGELVTSSPNSEVLPPVAGGNSYIKWLLDPGKNFYFDIFNNNNIAALPSQSLLFLLLRQSLLHTYREAALNILQKDKFFTEPFRRILGAKESYMGPDLYRFRTKWTHLLKRLSDLNSSFYFDEKNISAKPLFKFLLPARKSLSDYIHNPHLRSQYSKNKDHLVYIQRVEEIKQAMAHLNTIPSLDLEKLLAEHLDLCTYRLDAWMSGFANRRLQESRKIQDQGIFLGAYAWVENLRPGGVRNEVSHIPKGLADQNEKVYKDKDNQGFIHAPSINHAISAAILRSGYLANDEAEGNLTNRMAVNLSSRRVRKALLLLNGLRGGSDLPSLLGYQFERGLHERYHEAELDKFILPFRNKFPLIVPITEQSQENAKPVHTNVVHGLNLLEAVTDLLTENKDVSQTSLYEYLTKNNFAHCPQWLHDFVKEHGSGNNTERTKELRAIIRELDQISDAFDALGDVAVSESVYQIVNGNHVRAAAMLSALGDGTVMPEPQVINTPRTGRVVTHRVILNLEVVAGNPPNWTWALTPRAKAEPKLNHYIASKLPSPDLIRVLVKSRDTNKIYEVELKEIELQPIDFLFLLSSNKQNGNADLLDLFIDKVRQRGTITNNEALYVDFTSRLPSWGSDIQNFYEIELLLQECKNMLHDAKAVGYTDMRIPDENPEVDNPNHFDLSGLQNRINQIVGDIKQLRNLISDIIAKNDTIKTVSLANDAIEYLQKAGLYGITNLLANITRDNNEEEFQILFDRLVKTNELLTTRIQEAEDLQANVVSKISTHEKAADLQEIVKKVFGENFIFIPVFEHSEVVNLKEQLNLAPSKSLLRASTCTFPMDEWLQGIADVRKKMHAYEMIHMIENRSKSELSNIKPVQFPYDDGDYWLGLDFPSDYEAEDDKLSLVLLQPEYATQTQQAGLVIDEWLEIIPNRNETTGITFQYDQPDSTPPQTILLAVSPKPVTQSSKWDWDHLVYTLIDTFKMAKNRTVEPDQIEDSMFGHMLPSVIAEVVPPQLLHFEDDDEEHINVVGVQAVLDFAVNLPEPEEDE